MYVWILYSEWGVIALQIYMICNNWACNDKFMNISFVVVFYFLAMLFKTLLMEYNAVWI